MRDRLPPHVEGEEYGTITHTTCVRVQTLPCKSASVPATHRSHQLCELSQIASQAGEWLRGRADRLTTILLGGPEIQARIANLAAWRAYHALLAFLAFLAFPSLLTL